MTECEINIKNSLTIKIEQNKYEDKKIDIYFDGIIDSYNYAEVLETLKNISFEKHSEIVFNCKNLNYICASGVGVFLDFISEYICSNSKECSFEVNPKLAEIFGMLGMNKFLTINS